jgi:hypothetical protein
MKRSRKAASARLDGKRVYRTGLPEVVFAPSKSDAALVESVRGLAKHHDVLVTKCDARQLELLSRTFGKKVKVSSADSGVAVVGGKATAPHPSGMTVAVVSAGSSDHRVAEEAALCAEYFGFEVVRLYDRGVAGLHRARNAARECERKGAKAVIAVAGMEGTLPSVLAGLLRAPVVAVPTSVGYGTGHGGLAAMSTMLNSCSPGILTVNIDNGFGAAAAVKKFLAWDA